MANYGQSMKFVPGPQAVKQGEWVRLTSLPPTAQGKSSECHEEETKSPTSSTQVDISDHICGSGCCGPLDGPPALSKPTARIRMMVRSKGRSGVSASAPVKAYLSYYSGVSSAANSVLQTAFAIAPNQDSSWASWQATFDEFRVVGAEFIYNTYFTTVPSVYPANSPNAIVVYDPTSSVTLASVNAGMQFEKFSLLRCMLPIASPPLVSPQAFTEDGCRHFKVKIPRGTVLSNTVTTNSTGLWRNTADAVNYDWGSFACCVSVGGTSAVLRIEGFVRMEVEFRTRR